MRKSNKVIYSSPLFFFFFGQSSAYKIYSIHRPNAILPSFTFRQCVVMCVCEVLASKSTMRWLIMNEGHAIIGKGRNASNNPKQEEQKRRGNNLNLSVQRDHFFFKMISSTSLYPSIPPIRCFVASRFHNWWWPPVLR